MTRSHPWDSHGGTSTPDHRLDATLREVRHRQLDLEFQQLKLEEKAGGHGIPGWGSLGVSSRELLLDNDAYSAS